MLYTADFETTVDPNDCRVWAYAICSIDNPNEIEIGNSIDDFMNICSSNTNDTYYFHNLRFDGEFIINWLFRHEFTFVKDRKEFENKTFTTLISNKGLFYSLEVCFSRKGKNINKVTFYDSLKIIPLKVSKIAEGFNLPISKLEIDYKQERKPGHILTETEREYVTNDVRIVAMSLKVLFDQGLTKMTAGSNALFDYKRIIGNHNFVSWYPIPEYDSDHDIRQSYRGGFTYLNPKYKEVDIDRGIVLDVNSLYP